MRLCLAISTYGERIVGAQQVAEQALRLDQQLELIIVHQCPSDISLSPHARGLVSMLIDHPRVEYLASSSQGLTKSRNIALKHCRADYLWVMDDDIRFHDHAFSSVRNALSAVNAPECLQVQSLTESGPKRSLYPCDGAALNARQLLRVASFEMLVKPSFCRQKQVFFREDMGVGGSSGINMGEESVFLADLLAQGGRVCHLADALLVHPDISTGVIINKLNVYSKGVVIRRCFSGWQRFRFFVSDLMKLLKDKDRRAGSISMRLHLCVALWRGCYSAR